jgi:serine/threonine protein kinase
VQEAVDVWSLGVMGFELLTGQTALSMFEGKDSVRPHPPTLSKKSSPSCQVKLLRGRHVQVMDRIEGLNGKELPWEGKSLTPAIRRRLGVFKVTITSLLSRDPAARPSMNKFCEICNRVLAGSSSVQV